MRPRYEARVATMRHRQQGHRPWVLVSVTHGTDDGVPVEFARVVASYGDRDDAIAEAEHRNDMQEGLRRIGVAVAVWAGMVAARRDPPSPSERVASGMVRVLRTLLADTEAELDAERAARRKWEMRLRWRAEHGGPSDLYLEDRLHNYLGRVAFCGLRPRYQAMIYRSRIPIAGPRGVLP